jgi:hypothetical protein
MEGERGEVLGGLRQIEMIRDECRWLSFFWL